MPDDNPYAAPQTIGLPATLVVVESADARRLRFTNSSTERLSQLVDYSYAIQQMHILWVLLAITSVLGTLLLASMAFSLSTDFGAAAVWLAVVSLIFSRVAVGYSRGPRCRAWAMFCDALLALGTFGLFVVLLRDGAITVAIISGFVCFHAVSSFLAHYHARELFGQPPIDQNELVGEVEYRKQNGIA